MGKGAGELRNRLERTMKAGKGLKERKHLQGPVGFPTVDVLAACGASSNRNKAKG